MGAEGGVTCYDLEEVLRKYAEMWPAQDFWKDLNYACPETALSDDDKAWGRPIRSVLTLPNGQRILLDYSDSEGQDSTLANPCYFNHGDGIVEIPEDLRWRWDIEAPYENGEWHKGKMLVSQMRVLTVLAECWSQDVEVWT